MKTDFVIQAVNVMQDAWPGDVKLRRGARNSLPLCNGDETTEMAPSQAATINNSYDEPGVCACGVITPWRYACGGTIVRSCLVRSRRTRCYFSWEGKA